jgi:hypothetical protein
MAEFVPWSDKRRMKEFVKPLGDVRGGSPDRGRVVGENFIAYLKHERRLSLNRGEEEFIQKMFSDPSKLRPLENFAKQYRSYFESKKAALDRAYAIEDELVNVMEEVRKHKDEYISHHVGTAIAPPRIFLHMLRERLEHVT